LRKPAEGRITDRDECPRLEEAEHKGDERDHDHGDPEGIVEAWRDRTSTLGREIWVRTGEEELVGVANDVDEAGGLLVETDEGTRRVTVGDCEHLRPVDGSGG
jgi:BirA family biotin operon repressor/biotin-[acetyl-CoA-carboxylase] ligase